MNDFPHPPTDNIAGVASFQFVEASGVESLPDPFNGMISQPIILKSGYSWNTGYSSHDSLEFSEEPNEGDNGIYFQCAIKGFIPDSQEINQLLNEIQGRWFILKITDNDGVIRIAGTLKQPLKFSSHFETQTVTGQKGHNYSFAGPQKNKSPIYKLIS